MTLTVGIDARPALLDPNRGMGRFTAEIIRSLGKRPDLRVIAFGMGGGAPKGVTGVELAWPSRLSILWQWLLWQRVIEKHPVDVIHFPAWGPPPIRGVPIASTVHDYTPVRVPFSMSRQQRWRAFLGLVAHRHAGLVHAVSRSTMRDAVSIGGLARSKLMVAHPGVDRKIFHPPQGGSPEGQDKRRWILYVGGADPHKRLHLLLDAWSRREASKVGELHVVGVGDMPAPEGVVFHGAVGVRELAEFYRRSAVLLFPSLWEGFGLPPLEAMASGCVPIVSRISSIPEVVGDAGVYMPVSAGPQEWLEATAALLANKARLAELSIMGIERAKLFRWDRTAELLVSGYRRLVEGSYGW